MKIIDLPVETRENLGSAESRRLRRSGLIPLVLYGGGRESINLSTTRDAFGEVLKNHSAIVRLTAGEVVQTALVREVSWDTFGDYVQHLDLLRVGADDEVRVRVPFHFVGVPAGVSNGGETHYALRDVQVLARVKDMPSELRIDIAGLELGDAIHVGECEYPEGVRPVAHIDELIVQVKAPKLATEETEEDLEGAEGADEESAEEANSDS